VQGRTEQVAALETTSPALKEQETTREHSMTLNYAAKEAYAPSVRDSCVRRKSSIDMYNNDVGQESAQKFMK
jgi:glycerol-3-phosphate dehydrogenase